MADRAAAIGPDQRRRALNAQLAGQRQVALQGVGAITGRRGRWLVLLHQPDPGLVAVGGAPHRPWLGVSLQGQQEGVDRDVVQAGQFGLQPPTVAAAWVAEDSHAPPALAVHGADGVSQRQRVEAQWWVCVGGRAGGCGRNRGGLCQAGRSEILHRLGVAPKTQAGSIRGSKKRIYDIIIDLYQTQSLNVQGREVPFRTFGSSVLDTSVSPYTGLKRIDTLLGYDREGAITITQTAPLKMTVLGIEYKISVG